MNSTFTTFAKFGLPGIAAILIGGGVAVHQHNNAQNLAVQNAQVNAQLSTTNAQIQALSSQVESLNAENQERAQAEAARAAEAKRVADMHSAVQHAYFDPRYKKLQSQVDEQGQAIDQARTDLTSTQSDLSTTQSDLSNARIMLGSSIALTHDELVLLEKRGERNYVEFELSKSKKFQRIGPISLALRKANRKRQYADLNLLVDDRKLTQKHVNLYQPAMFYEPDRPKPIEIVINSITKNHISGYISSPKYRQSELTAMATLAPSPALGTDAGAVTGQANPVAQPVQRLELPTPTPDDTNK